MPPNLFPVREINLRAHAFLIWANYLTHLGAKGSSHHDEPPGQANHQDKPSQNCQHVSTSELLVIMINFLHNLLYRSWQKDMQSHLFCGFREFEKFSILGIVIRTSIKDATVLEASITNMSEECCQGWRHGLASVTAFILTAKQQQTISKL